MPLREADVDTVILGCTHYPLIQPMLQRILGPSVTLISSGAALARQVEHALSTRALQNPRADEGDYRFLCTGDAEAFRERGTRFLQMPLGTWSTSSSPRSRPSRERPGAGLLGVRASSGRERRTGGVRHGRLGNARGAATGRAPDGLRPTAIEPGFMRTRDRLGADLGRRDARDLHRLGPGGRAALAGRHGQGLGDRRVRHAARLDRRAQAA